MTNLIDLSDYRTADAATDADAREAGERTHDGSARILLFTGVRYERMEEPVAEARRGRA